MKYRVCASLLMLLMCWASQSSAQTTRDAQLTQNSVEIIQKATPLKKLPHFDYLIKTCQMAKGDTSQSYAEAKNWNERHSKLEGNNSYIFDRMNHVQDYLFPKSDIYNPLIQTGEYKNGDDKIIGESIKILQLPKHGKLVINEEVRSKLNVGDFGYIADLNFEGDDKVVFSAKYHGKNYKVVMNLRVRYGYISDSYEGIELASTLCANTYKYIKLADASSKINVGSTD